MKPAGGRAVMSQRLDPVDSLDLFPTPPWATRALCEHVLGLKPGAQLMSAWEPAAGMGHMADVLSEYFAPVFASDVHRYPGMAGAHVGSFVGNGQDVITVGRPYDWIVTNPPFNLALEFADRARFEARLGVALLVRTNWLEGAARWKQLFHVYPPTTVALFVERVPMVKGRWDPNASTATSYAWVCWTQDPPASTGLVWIPPGCRQRLQRPDDVDRFAGRTA